MNDEHPCRFKLLLFVITVADPGFPRRGGANPQGRDANVLFGQKIPENCMKMKEFGPRGGGVPGAPLDPPMDHDTPCPVMFGEIEQNLT